MAIYINGIVVVNDATVEPVARNEAKNWMRLDLSITDEDDIIDSLITASRKHIEYLTSLSLVNKQYSVNLTCDGIQSSTWVVDLPYGPVVDVNEVKIKTGIATYDTLTKNEHYEVVNGKLWLYSQGIYSVNYDAGYGTLPEDLKTDILTLVAWSFENRGKKFIGDARGNLLQAFPNWDGLNYHQYKRVVI